MSRKFKINNYSKTNLTIYMSYSTKDWKCYITYDIRIASSFRCILYRV